jgi:hypothetical protein
MFKKIISKIMGKPEIEQIPQKKKVASLKLEITVRPLSNTEQEIRDLGKKATKYKGKDLNLSIDCLMKRKELLPKVATDYGIDQYLRLPKFLQQAGRANEAFIECNDLLEKKPKDKAKILDALRLIYQREKKFVESSFYGIISMAWQALEYKARSDLAPNAWLDIQFWKKNILSLLKKAERSDLDDHICLLFQGLIKNISKESVDKFMIEHDTKEIDYLSDTEKKLLSLGIKSTVESMQYAAKLNVRKAFEEYIMSNGKNIIQEFEQKLSISLGIDKAGGIK